MTMPKEFDHPCRDICSGWKQGYEKGQQDKIEQIVANRYHEPNNIWCFKYYHEMLANAEANALIEEMQNALVHADAACTYAFDDYGDAYYTNVSEHIVKALAKYKEWKK